MKRNRHQGNGKYPFHKHPVYTLNSSDDEENPVFLRLVKRKNKPTATVTRESKPSTTVTRESKPSATVTRERKSSATVTRDSKSSATATRESKPSATVTRESKPSATVTRESKPSATVTRESDLGEVDFRPSTTSHTRTGEASASTNFLNSSSESTESTESSPILPALIPLTLSPVVERIKSIVNSGIHPLDFAAGVGRRWSAFNDRHSSTVTSEVDSRNRGMNSALPVSDGFSDTHRRMTEHARRKLRERRTATVTRESDTGSRDRFKIISDAYAANFIDLTRERQRLMEKDQRFLKDNQRNSRDKRTATVTRESSIEDSNSFQPFSYSNAISILGRTHRSMQYNRTEEDERDSHDRHTETATQDSDIGNSDTHSSSSEFSFSKLIDTLRHSERLTNEFNKIEREIIQGRRHDTPTATAALGNTLGSIGSSSAFHNIESTSFRTPPLQSFRAARNLRRSAAAVSASHLVNAVEQQMRDYDGGPKLLYEITDDESSNDESNDESTIEESNEIESSYDKIIQNEINYYDVIEDEEIDVSDEDEEIDASDEDEEIDFNDEDEEIDLYDEDEEIDLNDEDEEIDVNDENEEIDVSDEDEDEDIDVNDEDSKKGRFAWTHIAYINNLPHIFRNGEGYIAVRLVVDIFQDFFEHLHNDIHNHAYITFYSATKSESKLLNQINRFHCEKRFGEIPFTTYSSLFRLDDVIQLYEYLEFCYKKLIDGTHEEGSKCGFIRINGQTIVPYTLCKDKKYIPLLCFESTQFDKLPPKIEIMKDWDLAYLKFCCRVQGIIYETIKDDLELPVITLENIRPYFSPFTVYEEGWVSDSDNNLLAGDNVPEDEEEYAWVKL